MEVYVCHWNLSLIFLTATWLVTCTSLYFRVLLHDERKIGFRWWFPGSDGSRPKFEVLGHSLTWAPWGGYGVPPPLPKFEDLGHPLELVILERKIGLRWWFSGSDGLWPIFVFGNSRRSLDFLSSFLSSFISSGFHLFSTATSFNLILYLLFICIGKWGYNFIVDYEIMKLYVGH